MLPTRVGIPTGTVYPKMVAKIPFEALVALGLLVLFPFVLFKSLWTLLLVIPAWSFLVYHAHKEPLFLRLWIGQNRLKRYYQRG